MKRIAFYLPQFHEIPENNAWWGQGFTEWTNVRRARPQFDGHLHPHRPTFLGEYDLLDPEVPREQSKLARDHGVDAFCIYFYWFDGKRLLEQPVEAWREDPTLLPYCLSWANESWTRRWDGKDRDVLMPQTYMDGFEQELFVDLLPHFRAPHYVRVNNCPVLVVHRADLIPQPRKTAATLRRFAHEAGLPGLHLVAAETVPNLRPESIGFDAIVEFPPVGANTLKTAYLRPLPGVASDFRGRLMSYERLARAYIKRRPPDYVRYRTVVPGWDNTARRLQDATIYIGSNPEHYSRWMRAAEHAERRERGKDGLLFINAWNEWAEGAYLEPCESFGTEYLRATNGDAVAWPEGADSPHRIFWSAPQLRSLAMTSAGSILSGWRRLRNRYRRG